MWPVVSEVLEQALGKKTVSGLDLETLAFQWGTILRRCRTPEEDPRVRSFGRNLPSMVE